MGHKIILYLTINAFRFDEIILILLHLLISDLFLKTESTLLLKIIFTETSQARLEQEVRKERTGADPSQISLL